MSKTARPAAYSAIQKAIGERIQWARELVEPNRAALARDMGVDRTTLQKIEDGERPPSIFNVLDLSQKLRISPDYILLGSLRGVDGELAAKLAVLHPELVGDPRPPGISSTAKGDDTALKPTKRGRQAA